MVQCRAFSPLQLMEATLCLTICFPGQRGPRKSCFQCSKFLLFSVDPTKWGVIILKKDRSIQHTHTPGIFLGWARAVL